MNTNKIIIISCVIIALLLVGTPTVYKVIKNHHDNLYQVVEEEILEAAKKCFYEEKCLNDNITLKELYELEYLEKMNDPITKEYYNEESYVKKTNNKFEFIKKE